MPCPLAIWVVCIYIHIHIQISIHIYIYICIISLPLSLSIYICAHIHKIISDSDSPGFKCFPKSISCKNRKTLAAAMKDFLVYMNNYGSIPSAQQWLFIAICHGISLFLVAACGRPDISTRWPTIRASAKNNWWGDSSGLAKVVPTEMGAEALPAGKHTKNHGKSPFFMGESTISMAIFNSFLFVRQRVNFGDSSKLQGWSNR